MSGEGGPYGRMRQAEGLAGPPNVRGPSGNQNDDGSSFMGERRIEPMRDERSSSRGRFGSMGPDSLENERAPNSFGRTNPNEAPNSFGGPNSMGGQGSLGGPNPGSMGGQSSFGGPNSMGGHGSVRGPGSMGGPSSLGGPGSMRGPDSMEAMGGPMGRPGNHGDRNDLDM